MILCSTASACNNPSDSITEIIRLEQFDYYNQKQNEVIYVNMENMDVLPPTATSLVLTRETCTPYSMAVISCNLSSCISACGGRRRVVSRIFRTGQHSWYLITKILRSNLALDLY